jgi:hypothetical protein
MAASRDQTTVNLGSSEFGREITSGVAEPRRSRVRCWLPINSSGVGNSYRPLGVKRPVRKRRDRFGFLTPRRKADSPRVAQGSKVVLEVDEALAEALRNVSGDDHLRHAVSPAQLRFHPSDDGVGRRLYSPALGVSGTTASKASNGKPPDSFFAPANKPQNSSCRRSCRQRGRARWSFLAHPI